MTDTEKKLRALLAEARQALGGPCRNGCNHPPCDQLRRIDAALAETPKS